MEEAEIMMTDVAVDTVEDVMIIEDTEESATTATTTVDMLPVESTATAGMSDMEVDEMTAEVVATMIAMIEVATVMVVDLVKLHLLLLMATQLLVERDGSHMPEVEETLMTDTVVNSDR